ncbi:MAG: N-acetylmuramoyl-L-alanine amidase, partial [Deltaproteobacteria bacterium]|nr:N-acetylmuramoyl-L-alanine amidase [Deltaproteobacteria bacterium]
ETITKKKKLPISKPNVAKDKYIRAEACYRKLVNNPGRQKYRNNWLLCIDKFQAVYRHDPSGPWAAAGLYMSGKLYQELYKYSYKGSDQTEALEIFKHVVKDYPNSAYSPRAADALGRIS